MKRPWRRLSRRAQSALLLAIFLVVGFGPLVPPLSSQPASRLALTAAVAEHHTIDISGYPLGIDRATYNGRLRSDKAPGQPLVAVPVYLVGRALGAESAATRRVNRNLGLWWIDLWTALLPWAALVALMHTVASRHAPPTPAFGAAVGLGVASMMLPHAVNLYGAALAALTAYGAWALLDSGSPTSTRLVVAGALAGASVVMEYETAIVLAVLAIVVIHDVGRRAFWYVLGAVGPLLVLAWYQWAAFGKPWRTAHEYYATAAIRRQIVGYDLPSWRGIDATFFGPHGLLWTNAIVLIALAAAAIVARASDALPRRHALIAVSIAVPYLVLCIVWKGTPALEEPGPRYMIPALPFLVVPLAAAWTRLRLFAIVAIGLSAVVAFGAATTNLLAARQQQVFPEMVHRIAHGQFLPSVWSMGLGRLGVVVYLVSVVGCGAALLAHVTQGPRPAVRTGPGQSASGGSEWVPPAEEGS